MSTIWRHESRKFSERLAKNSGARRKEVERLLAVARREAHLFQKVLADVFNYDQSDISRIEGGTRLTDAVELENFAVWYQKPLNFFQLGRPGLAKQAGKLEAVLTEDELRVRAVEAKVRRGRRKEEEDGHGYRSRTTRLKSRDPSS